MINIGPAVNNCGNEVSADNRNEISLSCVIQLFEKNTTNTNAFDELLFVHLIKKPGMAELNIFIRLKKTV